MIVSAVIFLVYGGRMSDGGGYVVYGRNYGKHE